MVGCRILGAGPAVVRVLARPEQGPVLSLGGCHERLRHDREFQVGADVDEQEAVVAALTIPSMSVIPTPASRASLPAAVRQEPSGVKVPTWSS